MRTVSSRCGRLTQRPYSDSLKSRVRNRIGLAAIAWGVLAVAVPQMPLSGHRVFADGPADNKVENIRPIPPLGIEVPAEVRESLVQGLASLQ